MTYPGGGIGGGGSSPPSAYPAVSNDSGSLSDAAIVALLKKRGVPAKDITNFIQTRKPTPAIAAVLSPGQIQQLSVKPGGVKPPSVSKPVSSQFGSNSNNPFGYSTSNISKVVNGDVPGTRPGQVAGTPVRAGVLRQATPITQTSRTISTGGIPLNQTQGRQLAAGGVAGTPVKKQATPAQQSLLQKILGAVSTRNRVVTAFGDAWKNRPTGASSQSAPAVENTAYSDPTAGLGSLGEFPTGAGADLYTAPEISMRDFSGEANSLAEQAYGPLFQAIAQGKTNAQGQYNTSDQVVKGLYDKLVQDTRQSGVLQSQQYDQASAEAAARAQALQDRQAQVYGDTANTQTALLERLGQQQSAPQVIAGGLNEQAFQQSQAATQGNAQQQYYQAGKQNANDYTTGIANAQNTQGTVAREGLVRDLANVLSQFDSQAAQGKTQQATTALDLANQLSSRDLQVQTANASNQMGAAQLNQSAQQQALAAQQAAYQNAYGQTRDARSDFESDRNYGLQENQFKLDAASAAAQAQADAAKARGAGTGPFVPLGQDGFDAQSAPQQVIAQADAIDPGRGQDYLGLFDATVRTFDLATNPSTFDFANKAAELAKQYKLSPAAAFAAASTYWKKIMNRS